MRSTVWVVAFAAAALAGCLYKSGGKYAGTFGIARAEVSPAEPAAGDEVILSLTVQFTGTTTAANPTATVKVAVDDGEPRLVSVALGSTAGASGAGVLQGNATVELGKLSAGEHTVTVLAAAPPGFVGAVEPPLVRKVTVKPGPRNDRP
jgi:hypothetical protein